ncbi:hypothetical protein CWE22_08010 [Pseudidiomarina aestuarii]|uniref:diguanylate cyclase n=1 Tax=Pseudidiomarina aestuarii TaxID=624146 RepID=A0A7Z6ZVI5_9GAMM|nr:GGDEF domain-containing protein [Pseudidiomarina aestuarii]RUO42078.1 hypothetical protein CWE22_08010 [Pseudidiomarina aestuarii]
MDWANASNLPQSAAQLNLWQHFRLLAMRIIYIGVGLVLLAFSVVSILQSAWLNSGALALVGAAFLLVGVVYRHELAPQWINFLFICALGTLVSISMKSSGILGVYWMYPVLAMVFFMFDKAIFVLVIMLIYAAFAFVTYKFLPFEYAWRIAISMLVLIGVGATFLVLMARMQKNLSRISATDALTGFYKRDQVTDILQQQIAVAQKHKTPLSLVILDLDAFKSVNDKYGYMVGDQVLQETAQRVKRIARPQDILVRSNGAALMVIFPNTPLKLAAELTSGMLDVMRNEPFAIKSLMMTITASAGVAQWQVGQSWGQWLEQADSAMDRAKSGGRNRMKVAR